MPSDNEERKRGLDMAFILGYNYSWIRDKLIMNDLMLNNYDSFLKILCEKTEVRFRNEQREAFLMMLRVESITWTVKYSEDLAAISYAFGKGHFKINETLKDYRTADVKEFFKKVTIADYEYIQKILGYPELQRIESDQKEIMGKSADVAKQYYNQVKTFYDKYNDLYNCYKHGLRLMPVMGEGDENCILKFPSKKNGEFEIEVLDRKECVDEYASALKVAGTIFTLLDAMFQNHRAWYFGTGERYECSVI